MDADHLDVCAIYNMKFERLYADLCRVQSETNDPVKRIQHATPYDVVIEFGTKLQTPCEMMKYTLERICESPHHPWVTRRQCKFILGFDPRLPSHTNSIKLYCLSRVVRLIDLLTPSAS